MVHEHNNGLQNENYKKHFRVTIFGSARIKPETERYKQVYELAFEIGKSGFDIVTGGGPGLMEAANAGHRAGDQADVADSIGITVKLPFEESHNKHLDLKKHFQRFSDRLDQFMVLSNVVVVTPGGVGTCLEFFYTWQLMQVKHICAIPIILVGDMWRKLIDWVIDEPLHKGFISSSDMHNIYCVQNNDQAMEIIQKANEMYLEAGDDYCFNFEKYKLH